MPFQVILFEQLNENNETVFSKKKNLFPVCFPICLNLSTFGEAPSQWLQVLGVIGVSYIHYSVPLSIGVDLEKEEKTKKEDLTVRSNNSLGRVSQASGRKFLWTKKLPFKIHSCVKLIEFHFSTNLVKKLSFA